MSTGYVIPDSSREFILRVLETFDDVIVTDEGDEYLIRMPIDPGYSLKKRVGLASIAGAPPDDVQQGTNMAQIFLMKAPDEINAWLWGTGTSISHPELILDRICEKLEELDRNPLWLSEHDDEYWNYA
jgi:hypothetical protein